MTNFLPLHVCRVFTIFSVPSEGFDDLRQKVESLQSALNTSKVDQALESVRKLACRPATLLDPFALLAEPEQLADHAREANHPQWKKFDAIFKQCRPLANSNSLAEVVLQLLGDKEERNVATQIRKIFKGHLSSRGSAPIPAYAFWGNPTGIPHPSPQFRRFVWLRKVFQATV